MKYKVTILLCILFISSGCTRMGSCKNGDLNLEKVFEEINIKINAGEWQIGQLQDDRIDREEVRFLYNLEMDEVEDAFVKQAVIPASCGEIAIIQVEDENRADMEQSIHFRVENMKNEFTILPYQKEIVENYQTAQNNEYFIFVVGEDASKVIAYFNSL